MGKEGNFGFGLAIAKKIFDKHNAKVTISNSDGAVFEIVFPMHSRD